MMSGKKQGSGASKGAAQTRREHGDEADQIPDSEVREAFVALRAKYGDHLNAALQDRETAEAFVRDPVATMRELGWDVPPAIRRLASRMRSPESITAPTYVLNDGYLLRPRIHVSFRSERDGDR